MICSRSLKKPKLESLKAPVIVIAGCLVCMAVFYFLGGEDVSKQGSWRINSEAFGDAGGKPKVLVFAWAKASFDRNVESKRGLIAYFRSLGASKVDFVDFSDSFADIVSRVESSNLLYLTGGLTRALLERMKSKGVDSLLQDYNRVIVGRSAGASALGSRCIITTRIDGKRVLVAVPGLGLVDFCVKAHYKPCKDSQLRALSVGGQIFGVPEDSALLSRNGVLSSIGKVYSFREGNKTMFEPHG